MSVTKIKGHRIGEKQIKLEHLHEGFQLPEDRMSLNYPTHNNEGDLTLAQKNTLTQLGNADSLHYHTGGGGGPQGIYTNEERDIQLLKLSMLINSTAYGMDKSVKDVFDNDESVYYGVRASASPMLRNITDDSAIGGLLPPNKNYTYGVAYKTLFGETNIVNTSNITTADGVNNSVELVINDVPPENTGIKIFRSTGDIEKVIVENEKISEWENPYNLDMGLNGTDKTNGLSSIQVSTKGAISENGQNLKRAINIAHGVGKRALSSGEQFGSQVEKDVPIMYYIQINNREIVDTINVVWDINPASIPIEYELYYTTDYIPTDISKVEWYKFERLRKLKNENNETLSISTDGSIIDDYKIVSNTRPQNRFSFKSVNGITAIKIQVNRLESKCKLKDLMLFTEKNSTNLLVYKDFETPRDLREFNTLKMDLKSNDSHKDNLKIGFAKDSNIVGSVTNIFGNYNGTADQNFTGQVVRMLAHTHHNNSPYTYSGKDMIRFALTPTPNKYIKFENIYIMLDNKSHSHSNDRADADIEDIVIPVTFNNGMPYYEGTPTGVIYSDWVRLPFDGINIQTFLITLKVVSGSLRYYGNNLNYSATFYTTAQGYEASLKWYNLFSYNVNWDRNFIHHIEVGRSNNQYLDFDYTYTKNLDKWHRHYIPLEDSYDYSSIKKLLLYFNSIDIDQDLFIDNVTLTRAKNICSLAAAYGSNGCVDPNNIRSNDTTYFASDVTPTGSEPKNLMLAYSQVYTVNKLIINFGVASTAAKSYAIQYTIDNTANANDPFESPKWLPVENLKVGEPGIPQDFTGDIHNNVIFNNNKDDYLTNTFDPVECKKIRIVCFSTIGDLVLRIRNIKLFTAEDLGELKLISEKNTKIQEGFKFLDDGKPTGEESPPIINTTGTYNVYYDSQLRLLRLIDKSQEGAIYLHELNLGLFINLILTAQTTGDVEFLVSNDGGVVFTKVTLDTLHSFVSQSEKLRFKILLKSPDATLNAIAFLYSL